MINLKIYYTIQTIVYNDIKIDLTLNPLSSDVGQQSVFLGGNITHFVYAAKINNRDKFGKNLATKIKHGVKTNKSLRYVVLLSRYTNKIFINVIHK